MGTSSAPHRTCAVFNDDGLEQLPDDAVHRFLVGDDAAPVRMSPDEARTTLGDRFAELVLLQGEFPATAGAVLDALGRAADDGTLAPRFFILGEGSLLPADAPAVRPLRFLVACGAGPEGPDVMLSAFSPDEGEVELMAWDARASGFNFYRTVGRRGTWVFAGNSRHALGGRTEGSGPFESHRSGNFLMKELRAPWINWDSPDAHIDPAVLPERLREHEWFDKRERQGALACERAVARPAIERWTRARFDGIAAAGRVDDPARIMRQVLDSPAVNLVSSFKRPEVDDGEPIDLPATFFVDLEGLGEVVEIPVPTPAFSVARTTYAACLARFAVRVTDGAEFEQAGDTFFAFVVPERAFEDSEALRHAIRIGLLTQRLAACLLMTDFPNPVFSTRRAGLLDHVPPGPATLADGAFSDQLAGAILSAADEQADDSPAVEFKRLWEVGEDFEDAFAAQLGAYHAAVQGRLDSPSDFDAVYALAESRRARVREMPIAEFPLLFSVSTITATPRAMRADGSVG